MFLLLFYFLKPFLFLNLIVFFCFFFFPEVSTRTELPLVDGSLRDICKREGIRLQWRLQYHHTLENRGYVWLLHASQPLIRNFLLLPLDFFRIFLSREILKFLFFNGVIPPEFFNRNFFGWYFQNPSFFLFIFFKKLQKFFKALPGRNPGRRRGAWCHHCTRGGHWVCTCPQFFKYGMGNLGVAHAKLFKIQIAIFRSHRALEHLVRYERHFSRGAWLQFFLTWVARKELFEAIFSHRFGFQFEFDD